MPGANRTDGAQERLEALIPRGLIVAVAVLREESLKIAGASLPAVAAFQAFRPGRM